MRRLALLAVLLSAVATIPAFAFERSFPASAKRGVMSPAQYPTIVINGTTRRLSVGARIWNEHNRIQMPVSLRGSGIVINYTENSTGDINRVWLLTPDEASQPLTRPTDSQPG